jgi:REP-associated tyrosine transposase
MNPSGLFGLCDHLEATSERGDPLEVFVGNVRLREREITRHVCAENQVDILEGVLSSEHLHRFVSIPPNLSVSDLMRKIKGCSSHKVRPEFPHLKKRYWGCRFWGRGCFSTTNGAITEDVILQYLKKHIENPTGASRK